MLVKWQLPPWSHVFVNFRKQMLHNSLFFYEVPETINVAGTITHKIENITFNLPVMRFHKHILFTHINFRGKREYCFLIVFLKIKKSTLLSDTCLFLRCSFMENKEKMEVLVGVPVRKWTAISLSILFQWCTHNVF